MLTGGSIANVSSEIATVTFIVKEKPAPSQEIAEGISLLGAAAGGVAIPKAQHEEKAEIVQQTPPVEIISQPLLDIVLESFTPEITVGKNMEFKIALTNFGAPSAVPVTMIYTLFDEQGNVVYTQEQQIIVETQMELLESIPLPPDLSPGSYSLSVSLSYGGQTASSSTTVTVASASESQKTSMVQTVYEFSVAAVDKVVSFFDTITKGIAQWILELFEFHN